MMRPWRELRQQAKLAHLGEKLYVWQQENAWCNAAYSQRLLRVYAQHIAARSGRHPSGFLTQADLFLGTWQDPEYFFRGANLGGIF